MEEKTYTIAAGLIVKITATSDEEALEKLKQGSSEWEDWDVNQHAIVSALKASS